MIGKDNKLVKILKTNSHHKLPSLKKMNFMEQEKNMSYEGTEVIQAISHTRFFSDMKLILSDSITCVSKATIHANQKNIQNHNTKSLLQSKTKEKKVDIFLVGERNVQSYDPITL